MMQVQLRSTFSRNLPTIENSIAIFENWVSALPFPGAPGGTGLLFAPEQDPRPSYLREVFRSLDAFDILELGSLEGAHSYQLELLGARSITGIEANAESFLKSLIIKEALNLKAKFLYGDFIKYLEVTEARYDLIFCCGVLYHMTDPIHLLHLISQHTDRVFIWSVYVSVEAARTWPDYSDVDRHGLRYRYFRSIYDKNSSMRHYSGVETYSCHLLKEDILRALECFGFGKLRVMRDDAREIGSTISIVAYR